MSPVLKDRKLSIPLKVRLLKCFIWSVLLYGCESWTLSAALTRNIEATEMWSYRRMLRVSYTAHETNISVLQRLRQERQLLRTIKERQTRFTGHIIRKGELEDLILVCRVQGKKARGGQRLFFPQSSNGKHRTIIPENHMRRRKKSNFEHKKHHESSRVVSTKALKRETELVF